MSTSTIVPRGPFDLRIAGGVFRTFAPLRHQPGLGNDGALRLGFVLDRAHVPVAVSLREDGEGLRCEVFGSDDLLTVTAQVGRILSLDHDGSGWPAVGEREPSLGALQRQLSYLRPVCFTSPYECACWAVISQRISKAQAAGIVGRIVAAHGRAVPTEVGSLSVFPTPQRLLALETIDTLPAVKVQRLHGIAAAALGGELDASRLREPDGDAVEARLRELPGIGPFWAAGIRLRAGGVLDEYSFDPASVDALAAAHGLHDTIDVATCARLTEPYRPYRMWACFLHRVAVGRGLVNAPRRRAS